MKNNNNNKLKKSNLLSRLILGINKGWEINTLPSHILQLQMHPLIRIFRVLGGISLLLVLSKKIFVYNLYILYIVFLITILYGIYITFINYHRYKHIYKILKDKKELEIRNSPLDRKQ